MSWLQIIIGLGLLLWGCGIVYLTVHNRPKWPPTWRQDWPESHERGGPIHTDQPSTAVAPVPPVNDQGPPRVHLTCPWCGLRLHNPVHRCRYFEKGNQ